MKTRMAYISALLAYENQSVTLDANLRKPSLRVSMSHWSETHTDCPFAEHRNYLDFLFRFSVCWPYRVSSLNWTYCIRKLREVNNFMYTTTLVFARVSGMAKRTGRPKLPAHERRSEVFSIRLTKAEKAKISAAAKKLDPREWARQRLLEVHSLILDAASLGLAIRDCKERGFPVNLRTQNDWKISLIFENVK